MAALPAQTLRSERVRRTARAPRAGLVNFSFNTSSAERGRISSMIARAKTVDILLDAAGTCTDVVTGADVATGADAATGSAGRAN